MDKLTSNDRKRFNEDGFLIVDKLIKPATVSVLHQAFTDLFDGKFETGVRPDEVNWQTESGDTSLTWHGSGENSGELPRRSLVLHAMRSDVEYQPENFGQGIGPIYSRYKRLGDNQLDENYFPILWREDGYRTPQIDGFLR